MKKYVLIVLTILLIVSGTLLGFNYKEYVTNNDTKKDYEQKITQKEEQGNDLKDEAESLKKQYEELSKEKEIEIEKYNEWKKRNEEIVSYLA